MVYRSTVRALLVAVALQLGGCAGVDVRLNEAAGELRAGHAEAARQRYQALASDQRSSVRVRASLGAAHASLALGDSAAHRAWLERAADDRDVPMLSSEACFELAELLRREGARPRALNYYYRAAGLAQGEPDHQDIYRRSLQAISDVLHAS